MYFETRYFLCVVCLWWSNILSQSQRVTRVIRQNSPLATWAVHVVNPVSIKGINFGVPSCWQRHLSHLLWPGGAAAVLISWPTSFRSQERKKNTQQTLKPPLTCWTEGRQCAVYLLSEAFVCHYIVFIINALPIRRFFFSNILKFLLP